LCCIHTHSFSGDLIIFYRQISSAVSGMNKIIDHKYANSSKEKYPEEAGEFLYGVELVRHTRKLWNHIQALCAILINIYTPETLRTSNEIYALYYHANNLTKT